MTPAPTGTVVYFFNTTDMGKLYYITDSGTYYPASQSMQDACACGIGETWMEKAACAMERGIITVSEYMTIINGGIAVVTASTDDGAGNRTSSFVISSKSNVESISLNLSTSDIAQNDTLQLIATILPASAPQLVTWASSDTDVATVNSSGLVGVQTPTVGSQATIYAYSVANPAIYATCIITVTA